MIDIKAFNLNQLKLLKKIGAGSFGTVFQSQNKKDGKFFAAKISSEYTNDENIKNQMREVKIISKVNHPLILKFIGYSPVDFHNENKLVIITEFIKNGTLESFIDCKENSRESFYWNDTRKLITIYGIAAALSYLHSHNILHRDLKPSNILIDDYLLPKISDFGLSKINHNNLESLSYDSNESSDVKGTAIYISPEIYETAKYSEAGDVYAFGMIVYQIMTKCKPFKGCTIFEIFKKVSSGIRPEFNTLIPNSYRLLIDNCWAQKPEERPNFNSILTKLRSDSGFVTETIDQQYFRNFVNYIDQFKNDGEINSIEEFNKGDSTFLFKKIEINQIDLQFDDPNEIYNQALKLDENGIYADKEEAAFLYKTAADKGHINAMFKYALKLQIGDGIIKNSKEAAHYFKLAADKGHNNSMLKYGMMLYNREGIEANDEECIKYIKMSADNKCIEAMNFYGKMLIRGDKVKMNKKESFTYFKKAADFGCIDSMKICAFMLSNGDGVNINLIDSLKYYKMAADKGDADSMYEYANMMFSGKEIAINKEEAAFYYKEAAKKGHVNSMYNYAMMLLYGDGIPENKLESFKYFKEAATFNHLDAIYNYARMLFVGEGIISPNKDEAFINLKQAAKKGHVDSMYSYASILFHGDGVKTDKKEASCYFKLAADKGHSMAMFNYGMMLYKGNGIAKNTREGSKYIQMSADRGYITAMNFYANLLEYGIDVPKDDQKALRYYRKANNKEKIIEMNNIIHHLTSLEDFEITNRQLRSSIFKTGFVKSTGQPVVLKFAPKTNDKQLKNETNNLFICCHPSIQKVVGFFNSINSNQTVLITPYYQNSSLDNYIIHNKKLKLSDFYEIILGVCLAMKYLEDHNLFHGNLKPSNILLDDYKRPILNDIQMKENYSNDEIHQNELVINYFAPEILSGGKASIKSDVYTFGLLINQIITKKMPYDTYNSKNDIINAILDNQYEISQEEPSMNQLILNCLNPNPIERPSFNTIYNDLCLIIDSDLIHDYIKEINSQIQCPITFFRIPKIIMKSPDYLMSNTNDNNNRFQNFISIDNINKVLSKINDDKAIKIIMVCGKYQSGKSTFLRALTGNGAYYSGTGLRSTTKGIIIDGPYSSEDLINRIGLDDFKKTFSDGQIELKYDPAIFIIDSQGIGNEMNIEQFTILKRVLSIFCTLSDLCIDVTEYGEVKDNLENVLNIIRQSQMMKFNNDSKDGNNEDFKKEITKIIFLVKNIDEMQRSPQNKKTYFDKVQRNLQSVWYSEHQTIENLYMKNLTKVLPLSDLHHFPLNYNCSVWNVLPDIFCFLNISSPKTKVYVKNMLINVSNQIFAEFVNQLCENCTTLEDQINLIAEKIVGEIQFQINEYRAESISRDCAILQIQNLIRGLEKIIIPLTVAQSTNINFQDKNQYIYDLNKDIRLHIEKNIPEIEKYLCVGFGELFKESFANSKWICVLPAFYFLSSQPYLEIGAVIAVTVSFLIYLTVIFARSEIKRNMTNSIARRKVKLSIPHLWEKVKENSSIVRELRSIDKVKGLSFFTLYSKELIIVLEDTKSNFMKLIIQSMTGIDCHFKDKLNENKEAILYGPINKASIMERISRYFPSSEDDSYYQKVLILYLRGYDTNDLHQIENIQSKASFFMSSETSLCHLPTVKNKIIHFFVTFQNEDIAIIKKKELENLQNKLIRSIQSDDFHIISWPILMKDKRKIELIGPQTNKSLRFDFHQIFGHKRDEK